MVHMIRIGISDLAQSYILTALRTISFKDLPYHFTSLKYGIISVSGIVTCHTPPNKMIDNQTTIPFILPT